MSLVIVKSESGVPKYKQIIASIESSIKSGTLKKGDQLPSINSIKNLNSLSRDTVLMAFNELKARGIVQSIVGKGYYVISEDFSITKKIFLLFDELNAFKEDLYSSFLKTLTKNIEVDIFFHYFNHDVFNKLITDNVGNYSAYIIMPANLNNTGTILSKLPKDKVYILDQTQADLSIYPSIYQDFKNDTFKGLKQGLSLIQKYKKIILLFSQKKQPIGILEGFKVFCRDYNFDKEIIVSLENRTPVKNEVYVVLNDRDLLTIIKKIKEEKLTLGKDIGVISYNDTLLKEIVEGGITTISTNFKLMGQQLGQMVMNNESLKIENPFSLIIRNSL